MASKGGGFCFRSLFYSPFFLQRPIILAPRQNISTTQHCLSIAQKDYYKLLGVSKKASTREIRDAYVELAKKTHPDSFGKQDVDLPGVEFMDIQEAYEVLGDQKRRLEYDTTHFGYERKSRVRDRYKAKMKTWNRQVKENFHPDSRNDDEK